MKFEREGVLTARAGKQEPLQLTGLERPIPVTPDEGVIVGNDAKGLVGDYPENFRFNGEVEKVTIRVSDDGRKLQKK